MIEVLGDLWEAHGLGHWVAITTNGVTRKDGACVMGRGVALEAAKKFPYLPYELGDRIQKWGNHVHVFETPRILSFPVKHHWRDPADMLLIHQSALEISSDKLAGIVRYPIYLVRPGCGNGRLRWQDVRHALSEILDDRFIIVEREPPRE
jgi:hypothetical protein